MPVTAVNTSLNVPVEEDEVRNSFRLTRGLNTINYLVNEGAKVILMGHIGRDPKETLLPVYRSLLQSLDITFTYDVTGSETKECISNMKDGQVVLLENLRRDPREKAKAIPHLVALGFTLMHAIARNYARRPCGGLAVIRREHAGDEPFGGPTRGAGVSTLGASRRPGCGPGAGRCPRP